MSSRRKLTGAIIPFLAIGAFAVVSRSPAGEDVQIAARAECMYDPAEVHSSRELWHTISRNAELVAPSDRQSDAVTSSHKRRAVSPPAGSTFTARNFIDSEIFGKMVKDNIRWTIK
ncbi:MAG: hypothetical protein ACXW29_14635 [Thermoanaerobaculia bacterium]